MKNFLYLILIFIMFLKEKLCGKPIYLTLSENYFNKGDILTTGDSVKLKVVKTYKLTWWRKLLMKLGFKIRSSNCIKCKIV